MTIIFLLELILILYFFLLDWLIFFMSLADLSLASQYIQTHYF